MSTFIFKIPEQKLKTEEISRKYEEKVKQQQSDQSEYSKTLDQLRKEISYLITHNEKFSTEFSALTKANSELVKKINT